MNSELHISCTKCNIYLNYYYNLLFLFQPLLSIAKFESLKQLSYDLDTVYREQYIVCDKIECVPSNQQLQTVNQTLTDMITKLEKQSQDLHGRLVLMVEWWKEYEDGHKVCYILL